MELDVIPEGLLAASAQVAALTGQLSAAGAAHAAACAAILPPGSDKPSLEVAAALHGHHAQHQAMAMMGNEELGRSGAGVAESGVSYLTGDALSAAALGAAAV
ncbi:PE family protein [Mycobacterium servetii]|uniref:PE family protein n=1 Tax=Mycobacterium servetii TaxID=3237418 RepID=A0ABV4CB85_9MYCO